MKLSPISITPPPPVQQRSGSGLAVTNAIKQMTQHNTTASTLIQNALNYIYPKGLHGMKQLLAELDMRENTLTAEEDRLRTRVFLEIQNAKDRMRQNLL